MEKNMRNAVTSRASEGAAMDGGFSKHRGVPFRSVTGGGAVSISCL